MNERAEQSPGYAIIPVGVHDSPAWAMLTKSELNVYIALARHASGEIDGNRGNCYPRMERIALYAKTTVRTAGKATRRLCDLGLIERDIGGGRSYTNNYILLNPVRFAGVCQSTSGTKTHDETLSADAQNPVRQSTNPVQQGIETLSQRTAEHTSEQTKEHTTNKPAALPIGGGDQSEGRAESGASARDVLERLGAKPSSLGKLPEGLTADRVVREFLGIDPLKAKNPIGLLVHRLKSTDSDEPPQPSPKAVTDAWNSGQIAAVTHGGRRLVNNNGRMKFNDNLVRLVATDTTILMKDIPDVIFE
jgi:hypothetical protein